MKCPKCGYLGFETSDRCRNCGYDFSLSVEVSAAPELPLRPTDSSGQAFADLALSNFDPTPPEESLTSLDLDRMIGSDQDVAPTSAPGGASAGRPGAPGARNARSAPGARSAPNAPSAPSAHSVPDVDSPTSDLPLFGDGDDDTPLITTPRPVRAPLAVRRTSPEIPRTRARRVTPRHDAGELDFPTEEDYDAPVAVPIDERHEFHPELAPAPPLRRGLATALDLVLLAAINVAVVYLTLALAGLRGDQIGLLPVMPIVAFFLILDGGYLIGFIAASGQTVGKMIAGVRVVRDDGGRVDIPGATVRALGCGVSVLTAGLAYLPAFVTADRRALQDRMAGTRVVSAR